MDSVVTFVFSDGTMMSASESVCQTNEKIAALLRSGMRDARQSIQISHSKKAVAMLIYYLTVDRQVSASLFHQRVVKFATRIHICNRTILVHTGADSALWSRAARLVLGSRRVPREPSSGNVPKDVEGVLSVSQTRPLGNCNAHGF